MRVHTPPMSLLCLAMCVASLTACAGTDGAAGGPNTATDAGVDAALVTDAGTTTSDTNAVSDVTTDTAASEDAIASEDVATSKDATTGEPHVGVNDAGQTDPGTDAAAQTDTENGGSDTASPTDAANPTDAVSPSDGGAATDAGPAPGNGCCKVDSHCKKGQVCFFGPFNAGKCMTTTLLTKGQCWTKDQCGAGATCEGAMACGCDAICKAMDKPGTCSKPTTGNKCVIGMGSLDTDCGAGSFCKLPTAGCSGTGICTVQPKGCTKEYFPMCGCDGTTYGNACMAASAGRNVKSKGTCALNPCATVKCGDGNACTSDACDPKTGKCVFKPLNGAKCNDGNACTLGDVCDIDAKGLAYCAPGNTTKQCKPGSLCEIASCNPKTGQCEAKVQSNCNYGKTCSLGLGAMTIDCGKAGFCKLPIGKGCTGFGTCQPKPTLCTKQLAEVCACDGKTYDNLCFAQVVGQNAKSGGACGGTSGCCKLNADCKKGDVCIGGGKGGKGSCKSLLALGKNQCWSDAQCPIGTCGGASVCPCGALCIIADHPGACNNGPATCKVGNNATCAKGEYCSGACGDDGKCAAMPAACAGVIDPVCGCNGKTYSSACSAASAGVSVKAKGKCGVTPKGCCKEQGDCQYKDDVCVAGPAGLAGMCKNTKALQADECWNDSQCGGGTCKGPIICPCGAQCKVADKPGICSKPGCVVGGKDTCQASEFCDGLCGQTGKCVAKPQACLMIYQPVCGCDGKTYGNGCSAHSGGVAVASKGKCPIGVPGCCSTDSQCKIGVCVSGANGYGICKPTNTLPKGKCWTDAQCGKAKCVGAQACPCNAKCLMPDKAGTCSNTTGS